MIKDINDSVEQRISHECSIIYKYLRQNAARQSPLELIRQFQDILQQTKKIDARISQALREIILVEQGFNTFLTQCFCLILDVWMNKPESLACASQLLNSLNIVVQSRSYDHIRKQTALLIKGYQQSDDYQRLEQIVAIIQPTTVNANSLNDFLVTNESISNSNQQKTPLISSYLIRYTFLYPYFLSENITASNLVECIEQLQNHRQQDFEIRLSKHIIYRFRLQQLAKMKMMAKGAGKIINKADNPSLLSERAFRVAMQQYAGKNSSGSTLLVRSQLFVAENKYRQNYRVFKQDLCRFLIDNIKPRNNTYHFASQLEQKMSEIFPQAHDKPLNQTQILQTCRQLYSFAIVDPASNNNPTKFAELINNLGTAQVMMMLLKLVLICPQSKTDLERKICTVAMHYRNHTVAANPWLLKSLEHLLIAFSIYFEGVDVSIIKSAI